MRLRHSFRKTVSSAQKYTWPVLGLATVTTFLIGASRQVYSPMLRKVMPKSTNNSSSYSSKKSTKTPSKTVSLAATTAPAPAPSATSHVEGIQSPTFNHANIITTYFWVGEKASSDNGYIANNASAWDGSWESHFGGEDMPATRNGYYPATFTPKENPFYFALPYSDIDDSGNRKASATSCPLYPAMKGQPYSWCKNSWIAIRKGSKIVYAQWEDVGPFEEDDTAYVFGNAAPKNGGGVSSGLDVSPAVRDYLGLQDVDNCDWGFVSASNVPSGPWAQIITTDPGDSID